MVVTVDGKRCLALISCHRNDTFSYFHQGRWVTGRTVPQEVLDDPQLPDDERCRVISKLNYLGRSPSWV
jgi:hypothetical protein